MKEKVSALLASLIVVAIITTLTLPGRKTPQALGTINDLIVGSLKAALGST